MTDLIELDFDLDELTPALARVIAKLGDTTELMQDIGELMVNSTKQNFAEGTDPDGDAWAPKSMATLEAYRRREGKKANASVPSRPLIGVTRMLSTTISYEAQNGSVEWGSNQIQAAVMQFGAKKGAFGTASNGSSIPWGNIPARPFLGFGEADKTAIQETIEDYLQQASDGR
ncbi:phage virion morphogenesis protein [Sagittula sp. NFXS13]|uniref:phage virion morphogenesis protein n=1 Tax=Sagittula sp. NFXS13 TaxID=2819095 RepID=UPI0032DFAA6A